MKRLYGIFAIAILAASFFQQNRILAMSCVDEPRTVAAIMVEVAGIYDVYVKTSNSNSAAVQLRTATGSGCSVLRSERTNTANWALVGGGVTLQAGAVEVSIIDNSASGQPVSVSKPEVLFINQAYPAQVQGGFVQVKYDGESAVLHPRVVSEAEAAITVFAVSSPYDDEIRKVDYYADGEFVYSKRELENFSKYLNIRPDTQVLSTVVYFKSGQSLTFEKTTAIARLSFVDFVLQLYDQSSTLIGVLAVGLSAVVGMELLSGVMRVRRYRHNWLVAHGLRTEQQHSAFGGWLDRVAGTGFGIFLSAAARFGRVAVPVLMVFVGLMWLFVDMYAVEGISMEPSLKNGTRVVVSKTEKTFAFLRNGSMELSRGDVVIVDSEASVLPPSPTKKYGRVTAVKRVIGLPGDTVEVTSNGIQVTAANQVVQKFNSATPNAAQESEELRFVERRLVLGRDELFIVGDNWAQSIDSRFYGPVKLDRVIGRVVYALQPS